MPILASPKMKPYLTLVVTRIVGVGKITAMILRNPMIAERQPAEMTTRQSGRPKLFTLVASLLRLAKVLSPSTIIASPRKTKPDCKLSNGHFFAKYFSKTASSDTSKKMLITLVMKCAAPSKK